MDADLVLVATGRRPNVSGLGLEEIGWILIRRGGVKVDQSRSNQFARRLGSG